MKTQRILSGVDFDAIESDEARELHRNGHFSLGVPYDSGTVEELSEKFDELVENDETSVVKAEINGDVYSRKIEAIPENFPEVQSLLTDDISETVRDYYGGHFRVKQVRGWRNYHVPQKIIDNQRNEIFSDSYHFDRAETSTLKLFVYLSDVTEDDGPFHYLPIQQTKDVMQKGFKWRRDYGVPNRLVEDTALRLTGPAGSALLANTELCLHRAGYPDEGHSRDMIQIKFGPADEPLSEDWLVEDITT